MSRRFSAPHAAAVALLVSVAAGAGAQRPLPSWTRGATCYEVFVRSFYDSDGDGIGDLTGLTRKLGYIDSLGARCIWVMPVAQAASYHGYDVTDYYTVSRDYGTNADFRRFVAAAHHRGIRVLVDMVLNHVSDRHPWFRAALRDTTSPYRPWFRFSPTKPAASDPWGNSSWHKSPVRDEWYYAFFWGGMPDLDYTYPPVVAEAKKVARYWLVNMGVDGFRLDAVPYLVEEGDQVANTPGTHRLLHVYAAYVDSVKHDAYTVGEATGGIDTLLTYYPDQLDAYFVFPFADSVVAAIRRGTAGGVLTPIVRLQESVPGQRWSPFVENHDRPRLRSIFGGDMRRARLASFLALTMPGLPFVYQGEEIGMLGDKPDPRLRTPMQWRPAAHGGFTTGTPWEALQDDSMRVTVAAEEHDPGSTLAMHRRLMHLRSRNSALGSGRLVPLPLTNPAIVAYIRRTAGRAVLAVANLSDAPVDEVAITGPTDAAPPGEWRLVSVLGGAGVRSISVHPDGRIERFVLPATLGPLAYRLYDFAKVSTAGRASR